MRTYKRDKSGKFSSSGGSGGGKTKKTKGKKKKKSTQSKFVPNYRRTTTRALGDTSKEGDVSITKSGQRLRKKPVRKKSTKVKAGKTKGLRKTKKKK